MAPVTSPVTAPAPQVTYSAIASREGETYIAGQIRNLFLRARDTRRPLVQQWNRNYRILRNNYWSPRRPTWMPSPQLAEIFPIVASFTGWMTDQRPTFDAMPYALPHTPYHNFLSQLGNDLGVVLLARWQDEDMEAEVERGIWDSQIYGTGVWKTGWDDSLEFGMGDITMRRIDPYTWYPDPQANIPRDGNYFLEARTYTIQELDRRFPGAADRFLAGLEEDVDSAPNQLQPREEMPMANPGAISPATVPRMSHYGQSRLSQANIEDAGVTVFEAWIREHYYDRKSGRVYDTWRCIVTAGNTVLFNEAADDLWEHGQHPYERYVPYDLGEMWGLSLVELLTSPQQCLNRLLASLLHNVDLVGNPVFKEGVRSGLQRTQVTNKPGTRITVNDQAEAGWLQPPPLHESIPELVRYFLQRMEAISGLSAITKGGTPQGRNAQAVVDAMQEASFVRVRMALRNLEHCLRRSGQKLASLVSENYTVPRMVAYIGPDGQQRAIALNANHFYTPGIDGEQPLKFRLNVDVGAQSHTSRQAREDKAFVLHGLGAIDDIALLEAVDFPHRQEIYERVQKLKAAGAFQPPGARQRSRR